MTREKQRQFLLKFQHGHYACNIYWVEDKFTPLERYQIEANYINDSQRCQYFDGFVKIDCIFDKDAPPMLGGDYELIIPGYLQYFGSTFSRRLDVESKKWMESKDINDLIKLKAVFWLYSNAYIKDWSRAYDYSSMTYRVLGSKLLFQ